MMYKDRNKRLARVYSSPAILEMELKADTPIQASTIGGINIPEVNEEELSWD